MFIQSHMDVPVCYRKGTKTIVIKPRTVTYVNSNEALAEELKACYGSRISVITEEMANVIIAETVQGAEVPVLSKDSTAPEVTTDVVEATPVDTTDTESAQTDAPVEDTTAPEVTTDVAEATETIDAPADPVDTPANTTDDNTGATPKTTRGRKASK